MKTIDSLSKKELLKLCDRQQQQLQMLVLAAGNVHTVWNRPDSVHMITEYIEKLNEIVKKVTKR